MDWISKGCFLGFMAKRLLAEDGAGPAAAPGEEVEDSFGDSSLVSYREQLVSPVEHEADCARYDY